MLNQALTPIVVSLLTQATKKIEGIQLSDYRKSIVRFIVALLSFAAAVGLSALEGTSVEPTAIETFATAFVNFLGALGTYHIGGKFSEELFGQTEETPEESTE